MAREASKVNRGSPQRTLQESNDPWALALLLGGTRH